MVSHTIHAILCKPFLLYGIDLKNPKATTKFNHNQEEISGFN